MARFLKCDLKSGSVRSPRFVMFVRAHSTPPRLQNPTENDRDFIH